MDQVFYVVALMGCGDSGLACQQARVEPIRYSSFAACQQAMPAALERNTDIEWPVIGAACQQKSGRMAENKTAQPGG
jgi:hypothetical protein